MSQNANFQSPVVSVSNGVPTTTSLNIAKVFGKKHKHVLRDIEELIANCPESFHGPNFGLMSQEVKIGNGAVRKDPMYLLTRDAFTLLVMGYTGKQAMQFKLAYIEAFNAMEKALEEKKAPALPDFSDPVAAARAWADEYEAKLIAEKTAEKAIEERNEAIRTKSWIGDKRQATAMATASAAVRQRDKALDQLGEGKTWKQVKAIDWLKDVFTLSRGAYSQIGKKLVKLSEDMHVDVKTVPSSEYGEVKCYHVSVVDRLKAMLADDPSMLCKFRHATAKEGA